MQKGKSHEHLLTLSAHEIVSKYVNPLMKQCSSLVSLKSLASFPQDQAKLVAQVKAVHKKIMAVLNSIDLDPDTKNRKLFIQSISQLTNLTESLRLFLQYKKIFENVKTMMTKRNEGRRRVNAIFSAMSGESAVSECEQFIKQLNQFSSLHVALKVVLDKQLPNRQKFLRDCSYRGEVKYVKQLLSSEISVESASPSNGRRPLHWAARFIGNNSQSYKVNVIKSLLSHLADVDATDNDGNTPLHHACETEFLSAIPEILKGHPDCSKTNSAGKTGLNIIEEKLLQSNEDLKLNEAKSIIESYIRHKDTFDSVSANRQKIVTQYSTDLLKSAGKKIGQHLELKANPCDAIWVELGISYYHFLNDNKAIIQADAGSFFFDIVRSHTHENDETAKFEFDNTKTPQEHFEDFLQSSLNSEKIDLLDAKLNTMVKDADPRFCQIDKIAKVVGGRWRLSKVKSQHDNDKTKRYYLTSHFSSKQRDTLNLIQNRLHNEALDIEDVEDTDLFTVRISCEQTIVDEFCEQWKKIMDIKKQMSVVKLSPEQTMQLAILHDSARQLRLNGDTADAIVLLRIAIKLNPFSFKLYEELSQCYVNTKAMVEAEMLLLKALKQCRPDGRIYLSLAKVYMHQALGKSTKLQKPSIATMHPEHPTGLKAIQVLEVAMKIDQQPQIIFELAQAKGFFEDRSYGDNTIDNMYADALRLNNIPGFLDSERLTPNQITFINEMFDKSKEQSSVNSDPELCRKFAKSVITHTQVCNALHPYRKNLLSNESLYDHAYNIASFVWKKGTLDDSTVEIIAKVAEHGVDICDAFQRLKDYDLCSDENILMVLNNPTHAIDDVDALIKETSNTCN